MQLDRDIYGYIDGRGEEILCLLRELARIPAPSGHEEKRAAFCKAWLDGLGARGVYIDEALNVVYPLGCESGEITVYMAHSDVVFPDTEPLPLSEDDDRICCPGVGDDAANAVALLEAAGYIARNGLSPRDGGVLLVINSSEEGLGNLKGSRAIMERYGERVREFISFDGMSAAAVTRAVGSRRFLIGVDTEGGHSYNRFGNRNAIVCLAALICDLYTVRVPEGGKTTYNVGTVGGGTSVNTIAQHAEMLYEFRSDVPAHLDIMQGHLNAAIERCRATGASVSVSLLGERPSGIPTDRARQEALISRAAEAIMRHYGEEMPLRSGSTDANIPLSMGIPAITMGCVRGSGAHTREEFIEKSSLLPGVKVAFEMILCHF